MVKKNLKTIICLPFLIAAFIITGIIGGFTNNTALKAGAEKIPSPPSNVATMPKSVVKMSFEGNFDIQSEASAKFGSFNGAGGTGFISNANTGATSDYVSLKNGDENVEGKADGGVKLTRDRRSPTVSGSSTGNRITIPNSFSTKTLVPKYDNFSVSLWVNLSRYSEAQNESVIMSQSGADSMIYVLGLGQTGGATNAPGSTNDTTGKLGFMYDGGEAVSTERIQLDGWHHIALTSSTNGTNATVKGYLDGVQIATRTWAWTSSYFGAGGSGNFVLGQHQSNNGRGIDATIDELYIYDDVLTAEQVAYSYYYSGFDSGYTLISCEEPQIHNTIVDGDPLGLPENIDVTMSNGKTVTLPVIYNDYDFDFSAGGDFTLTGTINTGDFKTGVSFDKTFEVLLTVIRWNTITYNLNGGENNAANPSRYNKLSETITLQDAGKRGHTFAGWYSDSGFINKVTQIASGGIVPVTLYAKFTANQYTITFDVDGNKTNTFTADYGASIVFPDAAISAATPLGYKFDGWFYENDEEFTLSDITDQNITIYAKYSILTYIINYQLNNGTNSDANPAGYTVETPTIVLSAPRYVGYTFLGWYSDSGFTAGNEVTQITVGSTGIKNLHAKWEQNLTVYTVKFSINGIVAEGNNSAGLDGAALVYPNAAADAAKQNGYIFENLWVYQDGTACNLDKIPNQDLTLYAKYTLIKYNITYHLNNSEINDSDNIVNYTVEDSFEFKPAYKRGYKFEGWYSDSGFTSAKITRITTGEYNAKNLYPKFSIINYVISYELNGGINSVNAANYTCETATFDLTDASKTGYLFAGWYNGEGADADKITQITVGSVGNVTLYARYAAIIYDIIYENAGGENSNQNPSSYTIEDEKIFEPATKTGYTFTGWYNGEGEDAAAIEKIVPGTTGTVMLYARYSIVTYNITYNLDGGTNGNNAGEYNVLTQTFSLAGASKTGYTFAGWYDGTGNIASRVTQINIGSSGNITLYARYILVDYLISYNANGGAGLMNSSVFGHNVSNTLAENTFTRSGYTFKGWNTEADGSGTAYEDAAALSTTNNITLYAMWEENKKSGCGKSSSAASLLLIILPAAALIKRKVF